MMRIQLSREQEVVALRIYGTLDGSGAWRLLRLCDRLSRRRTVHIDMDGVDRLLSFGAAVLGARLPSLPGVRLCRVRPEHERPLRESGALPPANKARTA